MKRIEQLKARKYTADDKYRFRQIDFFTFVDDLSQPFKHKFFGCQIPFTTMAVFKPFVKPVQRKKSSDAHGKDSKQDHKEIMKGNCRIKIISSVPADATVPNGLDRLNKGCMTLVRSNLGPVEFKTYIKN
jgi:hypothetical protein